jgi:hypothetical protein
VILLTRRRYAFLNEFCRFGDASLKDCGPAGGGGTDGNGEEENDEVAE